MNSLFFCSASLISTLGCSDNSKSRSQQASEPDSPLVIGDCEDAAPATELELRNEFQTSIAPLFYRGQSEGGCVACHIPGSSHSVVFWDDVDKTFDELWVNGRLAPVGEPHSLLNVLDSQADIPMPLGGEDWTIGDKASLHEFACRLNVSDLRPPELCETVDPGFTAIRRLSAYEYAQTVQAQLWADTVPNLPDDTLAYGFDTLGTAQQLSNTDLQSYANAATGLSEETLYLPEPIGYFYEAEDLVGYLYTGGLVTNIYHGGAQSDHWLFKLIRAYITTGTLNIPYDGTYAIRVRTQGWGGEVNELIDGVWELTDPHLNPELLITANGVEIYRETLDSPFEAWGSWEERTIPLELEIGNTEIAVWLDNASWGSTRQRDVKLKVDWVLLDGPELQDLPEIDEDRLALFLICDATDPNCDVLLIENLLTRVWRRSVTMEEIERYQVLMSSEEELSIGLSLVLEAALLSPHFLFRPEIDTGEIPQSLTSEELAVRLSYFLWSLPPDEQLLSRVEDDSLLEDVVLDAEVTRMLADPRSYALSENFVRLWLQLGVLDTMGFDPLEFPDYDEELRTAMVEEVQLLFHQSLQENRELSTLLDSDTVWVNQRLAEHYAFNDSSIDSSVMREVNVGEHPRGGVLESAAFLTQTSHPSKTSPTKRGRWVLEQLLCQPPEQPPDNVETDVNSVDDSSSLQEMLAQHAEDPACASCHLSMDPIGIGFENFGPLGQWREIDDFDQPVNSTAELVTGEEIQGHYDLLNWIQSQSSLETCVVQKFVIYGTGQSPDRIDRCGMEEIGYVLEENGSGLQNIVRAVIMSPLFRQKRSPTTTEYEQLVGEAE